MGRIVKPMDHQIEMIAARQEELANAVWWEVLAASSFLLGACILLALVVVWWDSY